MRKILGKLNRNYIRELLQLSDRNALVVTFLYLIGATISPSHKILFVISTLYFLFLVYLTGSIKKTIIYSFFPFWLFRVGRDFNFQVVPAEVVESPLYWEQGRRIAFEFSPFVILAIVSVIIMFNSLFKLRTKLGKSYLVLLFLILYAFHFFSAVSSPYLVTLSFVNTLIEFSFLAWAIIALGELSYAKRKEKDRLYLTLFLIFFGMIVLESSVTIVQVFGRSVLGLAVEKVSSIPFFGAGAEESTLLFRPVGLNYHANSLANWMVTLFPAMFLLWFRLKPKLPKNSSSFFMTFAAVLILLVISLTLSRSAYLALFILVVLFFLFDRVNLKKALQSGAEYLNKYKVAILFIFIYLAVIIPPRIFASFYSLAETGGLRTRATQLIEAKQLISSFPLFGVGPGMYIPALFDINPEGSVRYFPEDIHNGFFLFIAERGILALYVYLTAIYFLVRRVIRYQTTRPVKILMLGGIIANYVMMLFQPFINTLSVNILIIILFVETKS